MITIAFWRGNIQLQRPLLHGCYRCRDPKILTELYISILFPFTISKHISYIPMCLLNGWCLVKFTSLNKYVTNCSSYMFGFFCFGFLIIIREKLEIIFHQTLAASVEDTCKDTEHFHKTNKQTTLTLLFYI